MNITLHDLEARLKLSEYFGDADQSAALRFAIEQLKTPVTEVTPIAVAVIDTDATEPFAPHDEQITLTG